MLILRLRQSEVALADGRLDEAFELANDPKVRSHRRGQRLVTRLVRELTHRGTAHLKAQRFTEALADCDKAAKLGGNLPDIIAVRTAAADALLGRHKAEQQQARVLTDARRCVNDGRLEAGAELLANLSDSSTRVGLLRREIDHKRSAAQTAMAAATRALEHQDWDRAIANVMKANASDPNDPNTLELASQLRRELASELAEAFEAGRLDEVQTTLERLTRVDPESAQTKRLAATLQQLHEVTRQLNSGSPSEARLVLARLANVFPKARWIQEATRQLEIVDDALRTIRTGPFGMLCGTAAPGRGPSMTTRATHSMAAMQPQPVSPLNPSSGVLPSEFVLRVDGVGSFLVFRRPIITIGPVSSSRAPDLGVMAEATAPHVTVERVEDDYFLRRGAEQSLLNSGDRVEISPRCRLTFQLPSSASTSAALDLSGARLPVGDIRRVILMDHDLIIGRGPNAHVLADQLTQPLALHVRDGQLFCQSRALPVGTPVEISGICFVIEGTSAIRR